MAEESKKEEGFEFQAEIKNYLTYFHILYTRTKKYSCGNSFPMRQTHLRSSAFIRLPMKITKEKSCHSKSILRWTNKTKPLP